MISPIAPIAATRRLLIVDDSRADRLLIGSSVRVASGDRYLVDEAENGVQALALLKDKAYAGVFLDVRMPGINGFEVLATLRESARTWPMVFMLSSSAHPDDIARSYDECVTAYLCKPSSLAAMREVVSACLGLLDSAESVPFPS
ncbi:MAG: CheY-like chemotaxis protein [Polyangiales bacterium]|jgi:CheY-like chemotaxis protein